MKKLLAAVTSFAMSASLMTSAFASSFNVSAAGSYSAVQPNVSIGEVTDVSVNKTAQADFVVTPEEVSVAPGETARVQIFADPGSHKCGTLIVALNDSDLPQGITSSVTAADMRCRAVSGVNIWSFAARVSERPPIRPCFNSPKTRRNMFRMSS